MDPKPKPPELDAFNKSVVYGVYLLYKNNVIARNNLKQIMDFIKKDQPPEDIASYLLEECKK